MSSNSLLFSLNNEGKVYALSTSGSCWREFMYLGLEFKTLSAVPHFLWAVGGDRQIYLHVHGLEIPIRVQEESYENERWLPLEGFSGRLLPTDRYHFSSQDGTQDRAIQRIRLPSMAWQWEGEWQLELTLDGHPLDHDGWTYAVDFPAQFGPSKQWKSCVRRRKWIRYRKFSAMNSWCAIAPLHKDPTQEPFIDVSIGGNQIPFAGPGTLSVWAITAHGRVMYRAGVSTTSPEGLKWTNISIPPNCDIKQISAGATGLVWALLWTGRAIVRKGITKDCPTGEGWLEVKSPSETKLTVISVGYNAVWAVSSDNKVWFRKGVEGNTAGTSEVSAMGTGWLEITGNMTHVSVGVNDQVFAIGESDKSIYWRSGISPAELTGKRWRMVQANMQLSRTSSSASMVSSASNNAKHQSLTMLNETTQLKSHINIHNSWEESHSAPIEHTLPIKPPKEHTSKKTTTATDIDLTGKSYETTLKNPRAWSPVRSVGSVVGMEAQPDSDSSVFDVDSGMYFDEEVSQTAWGTCDTNWTFVEAGACCIDPVQVPHWFTDSQNSLNSDLNANWRIQILDSLKNRKNQDLDLSDYGLAIDEKGWTRSCEARLITANNAGEDCILSLYWHALENIGTLSVFKPDGTIKFILNLGEITSIMSASEPGSPRLALTVPRQNKDPIKIQFMTEMEQEEWLNVLVDITSQINGLSGKPSASSVWTVTNSGDILNWDPMPSQQNTENKGSYSKEYQLIGKNIVPGLVTTLDNNFPPGTSLKIVGSLFDEVGRFHVNLQGPEVKKQRHKIETEVTEVHFHFNVRFDENTVVCNTKTSGNWGLEERYDLPLAPGQEFTINIICIREGFKVFVNEKKVCFYRHRLTPDSITSAQILGPMRVYTMEYTSTSPIIGPDEMYWRMIGGYLRRVESGQNGIVWGITHDHRVWVYTGGWGGGALKGIGSNDGINSMNDTQTYCIYENQRWNPLTGYTSVGLPTDRYMWSDITGKHKRTREHTKLLSRHWHWISEWMVDYNTPGGVDGDGWQYATDFPAPYHGKKIFTDCVRRRRWYRKAQIITEGPWVRAGSTPLLDISLWNEGETTSVWAVTLGGDAIYRTGVTVTTPAGTHWEHISNPQSLIAISTSCGIVWAVGRKGELYYREGITTDNPAGSNWKLIEAPKCTIGFSHKAKVTAKSVSLCNGAAWVILTNGIVVVRTGITNTCQEGIHWKYLTVPFTDDKSMHSVKALSLHRLIMQLFDNEMTFKQVSCGEQGVWGVDSDGALHRRLGVSATNPVGIAWQPALAGGGALLHVSARGRPL
ncbi:tectonin beta-propeller repeat-containing protein isoform X1 [Leguminivora glycinivorella]|uniref:tectonin beta-propeller repeat-containing protein isoform X1 n=1 Tax=Leguminivora glycinivorella TaxID=1035111 RepID=UPI00200C5D11|nr:tectonin beta-propeller repeat-containing protein isoform X1 [Leguminivora glycinivorella]